MPSPFRWHYIAALIGKATERKDSAERHKGKPRLFESASAEHRRKSYSVKNVQCCNHSKQYQRKKNNKIYYHISPRILFILLSISQVFDLMNTNRCTYYEFFVFKRIFERLFRLIHWFYRVLPQIFLDIVGVMLYNRKVHYLFFKESVYE